MTPLNRFRPPSPNMERSLPSVLSIRERFLSPYAIGGVLLAVLYCFFHYYMGGFMLCHVFFAGLVICLYLAHPALRFLVLLASPLLLKEALFDSMRYIPFHWLQPIHIEEPYQIDRSLFGVVHQGVLMPFNEFLLSYANGFLDLFFGVTYHLLEPVAYLTLILLWRFQSASAAWRYATAFLLMNLFAFATYAFYPAAAPWYVQKYGFAAPLGTIFGDPAGLARFDTILGVHLSANIYNASPFVFGAIPSMHAGITMMGFLFFLRMKRTWSVGMGLYVFFMWVGALYLQHHYVVDVLLGILYAIVAYLIVEKFLGAPVDRGHQWMERHLDPDEA